MALDWPGGPSTEQGQIDGALDGPDLLFAAVQRQQQPMENRLWPWRAARNVHIHRQAAVHSAGSRVAIGHHASAAGARADRNDELRVGRGLVSGPQRWLQVSCYR